MSESVIPSLYPLPKSISLQGGSLTNPGKALVLKQDQEVPKHCLPRFRSSLESLNFYEKALDAKIEVTLYANNVRENGYIVVIDEHGIRIEAFNDSSAYHGLVTLRQILEQHPERIPCLEISDWPDLATRGFMLDVSRCKVPKLSRLFELIDDLARLKFNQFQLYTEHTFAYQKHANIWRDASPYTAEDIQKIDTYCFERYIELVPNQNSFGHMERWLRHPSYHNLAECPNGFEHPLAGWKPFGSTLKPNENSALFVHELYQELLPNFRSEQFNIGGDEPWELGQGFSKETVKAEGKTQVYLEHLLRIEKRVRTEGKRMQFWGDIIIEQAELAKQLPKDVIALLWGYEVNHPFDAQCAAMAQAQRPFYVVPGTSTWNSIGGRLYTAFPNINDAAETAIQHGAAGLLLTEWGDNGHHQSDLLNRLPLLLAAGQAWHFQSSPPDLKTPATDTTLAQPLLESEYNAITSMSKIAASFNRYLHNASWLNKTLFTRPDDYQKIAPELDPSELQEASYQLNSIRASGELELARRLLSFAANKGSAIVREQRPQPIPNELLESFETHWLDKNRPGGLAESRAYLSSANP